jgi:hypothetical protein
MRYRRFRRSEGQNRRPKIQKRKPRQTIDGSKRSNRRSEVQKKTDKQKIKRSEGQKDPIGEFGSQRLAGGSRLRDLSAVAVTPTATMPFGCV